MSESAKSSGTQRSWTQAQQRAIDTVGCSLLISAAAGSGKTSVLAERCVRLLCDGVEPCEVGELLIVTFTESAAAEMKSRIAKSLAERHATHPTERTARHLAMLDLAHIGTLHSFCANLLRQNFQQLGIDPDFRILDNEETRLLKLDVADQLFNDRYDDADQQAFRDLVDCYADGEDDRLIVQMIRAYDTLCSVASPVDWLRRAQDRIEEAIDLPMEQSDLGKKYLAKLRQELALILRRCQAAGTAVKALKSFPGYVQELRNLYGTLLSWQKTLETKGLDALCAQVAAMEFEKLKPVSNSIDGKEIAKKRLDDIRDEMKAGEWRKTLAFTSDQWKDGLSRTLPHSDAFLTLVRDFADRYSKTKDEAGHLDFADLERLALRALRDEKTEQITALARQFHRQFRHVLVDEYQDINEVQDAILSLVSRECLQPSAQTPADAKKIPAPSLGNPGEGGGEGFDQPQPALTLALSRSTGRGDQKDPNLFCVGDVKQSIYRFRLADPERFLDKQQKYALPGSHGQVIDLQENFRSRVPLLQAINGVFERLMTREVAEINYDDSHKLKPGPGERFANVPDGFTGSTIELHLVLRGDAAPPPDAEIEVIDLDQIEREATLVGKRILELMGNGESPARQISLSAEPPASRPLEFRDIVILLRATRFKADRYTEILRRMNIPVHVESSTGYFVSPEVNDVLALLHVLDNQRQDIPMAALLRSPFAAMPDAEKNLARIRLAYRGDPPVPFHMAVQKYAQEQSDELATFLRGFLATVDHWRHEARQRPVAEMIWSLYDQTGYLAYVSGLPNGEQREANLIQLHDRARQFGSFERQGLGRFLKFLEKLKAETDLGQAPVASGADNAVRIMTIHASKGQEFPVVFVPDLGKAINMMDAAGSILLDRSAGLGMQVIDPVLQVRYPSLSSTVVQQRLRQQAIAEELRVLYVAMTRAKEHLILCGSCTEKQATDWVEQWLDHTGPLPAEVVLSARSPLEWLVPLVSQMGDQLAIEAHPPDDLAAFAGAHLNNPVATPAQTSMIKAQPLSPPPVVPPEAQVIINRLGALYPHQSIANQPASASVTSLVKKSPATSVAASSAGMPSQSVDRLLQQPAFLAGQLSPDAADKGTATHAVLEHFDFSPNGGSIREQIDQLVRSARLSQAMADLVDIPAIEWFLASETGLLIRQNAATLLRELPIYFSSPVNASDDPLDQPMIRGRIDLLVPVEDGWILVDYKTDRVSGDQIGPRADMYKGQLDIYRQAIEKMTGRPVVESALVFLTPRELHRV
jgi:ATP-dependent helicase/nuclease subunit A